MARLPLRKRILPGVLRRLARVGIKLHPFLVVREGLDLAPDIARDDAFRAGFVPADQLDDILALQVELARTLAQTWLQSGKRCFGLWRDDTLVACMWCDLEEFNYPPNRRALEADEAYLYAAWADPAFRGHGVAPKMRLACYEAMQQLGRTRCWSYTDYFNYPARRFKEKLNAQNTELRLFVELFGRWAKTVTLRRWG